MSTRTRIVIHLDGNVFFGAAAVKQLYFIASQRGMRFLIPNWKEIPKRDRLMKLAEYLIPEDALQIFQEPKGTRKSKSLYWQAIWNRRPKAAVKKPLAPAFGQAIHMHQYAQARAAQQEAARQNVWRALENVGVVEPPRNQLIDDEGI